MVFIHVIELKIGNIFECEKLILDFMIRKCTTAENLKVVFKIKSRINLTSYSIALNFLSPIRKGYLSEARFI